MSKARKTLKTKPKNTIVDDKKNIFLLLGNRFGNFIIPSNKSQWIKNPIQDGLIDVAVPKTDYTGQHFFIITIALFFFIILGLGYWLSEKYKINLNPRIVKIHVSFTLGITWLSWLLVIYSFFYPNKYFAYINSSIFNSFSLICSILIVPVQLLFLLNLTLGLFNLKKTA